MVFEFEHVVADPRYEGGVETFCLAINLLVVVGGVDVIHRKSATHFHQKFQPEPNADIGKDLRHNTVIFHSVLNDKPNYYDGVRFCRLYRFQILE